jgi:two-component system cell cycle response regulator DivK
VNGAGALVLVVEDNDQNLKLARDLLAVAGHRVLAAGTGEEGVRLAKEHRPDLVLLDVQLPGMDGFAALAALRADRATRGLVRTWRRSTWPGGRRHRAEASASPGRAAVIGHSLPPSRPAPGG